MLKVISIAFFYSGFMFLAMFHVTVLYFQNKHVIAFSSWGLSLDFFEPDLFMLLTVRAKEVKIRFSTLDFKSD